MTVRCIAVETSHGHTRGNFERFIMIPTKSMRETDDVSGDANHTLTEHCEERV